MSPSGKSIHLSTVAAAVVPLLIAADLRAADEPNRGTLTFVQEAGYNQLNITLKVDLFGSQTKTSTVSGTLDTRFAVDPATARSPEFTILSGAISATPVSFLLRNFFLGSISANSTTLGGTASTTRPPGTLDPATGTGDAAQHEFVIHQGSVSGSALGNPIAVDFASTPAGGSGSGTATVTFTPAGTTTTRLLFDVSATFPVSLSQPIPNDYGLNATFSASGTLKAKGRISIARTPYLAWTETQGIDGAPLHGDPDGDGVSLAMLWALGLGKSDLPGPWLIQPDPAEPRGFMLRLPPTGSRAPLHLEESASLAPGSWQPVPPSFLGGMPNPLPVGSAGEIRVQPSPEGNRFVRIRVLP
jgi:hypothetical protein